jgi:drug/metabolite transporter (DMT)-like permease
MTAVIAFFVLEESLHFVDWLATFVSFFGVLVITNPWAHSFEGMDPAKQFDDMIGSLAALFGAFFLAIASMQTRKLGKKVHFLVPPFYQAIFSAFIAPALMIIFLRYRTAHTTHYGIYEVGTILLISAL